jgi:hypothetical protein
MAVVTICILKMANFQQFRIELGSALNFVLDEDSDFSALLLTYR